jgi:hypothetical protein
MLLVQKAKLLAAGVAATLLLACGAAVLSAQGASLPRPALQQPAQRVRAAAGPSGTAMAMPDAPLSAEALSEALWVRLGLTNAPWAPRADNARRCARRVSAATC